MHHVITVPWSPLARWRGAGCYLQCVSECDQQVVEWCARRESFNILLYDSLCASQLESHNSAGTKRLSGVTA